MTGFLSVCFYRRILLTDEPIWFSFSIRLFGGPMRFYNYFVIVFFQPSKRITTSPHRPPPPHPYQVLVEVSRGIAARNSETYFKLILRCNAILKMISLVDFWATDFIRICVLEIKKKFKISSFREYYSLSEKTVFLASLSNNMREMI